MNAPSSRVVIAVGDPPPRTADLVDVVAGAESEPDAEEKLVEDEFRRDRVHRVGLPRLRSAPSSVDDHR